MSSVDYVSAINTKGSGLNITQIVESLVDAETKPKKDIINKKIDSKNLDISKYEMWLHTNRVFFLDIFPEILIFIPKILTRPLKNSLYELKK